MWGVWKSFWTWKQNWLCYLVVLIFFLLGAGLGMFAANNLSPEQLAEIHGYLDAFLIQMERFQIDSTKAARSILHENIIVISVIYFLGLTFVGIPFILALILVRGFILGFAVSCLSKAMSWPGFILAVVSLFPHNFIYLPALVVGGVTAISFALFTFKLHGEYRARLWSCVLGYTAVMLMVMAVTLGAGLIEAYFSPWLTRLAAGFIQTSFF